MFNQESVARDFSLNDDATSLWQWLSCKGHDKHAQNSQIKRQDFHGRKLWSNLFIYLIPWKIKIQENMTMNMKQLSKSVATDSC